jgi:hypothetical protein
VLALPVRPPVIEETQTMKTFNQISRLALAAAALAAASGAMAANGTVQLNAPLMTTNGVTATPVGADSYNSATGALTIVGDAANSTASLIDFGNLDGFKLDFDILGLAQAVTFSNFSYDVASKTLRGNLLGDGLLVAKINYVAGDLLIAASAVPSGSNIVASGFTVAPALTAYLTSVKVNASQLSAVTTVVQSVTLPTAVPEPTTYALMGLGLVGIALVARKRQA